MDSIPQNQRLVLAHYCYHSTPDRYYFNTCDQYTGAVPLENRNFNSWDTIKFLDCKLHSQLRSDKLLRQMLISDLNKFLMNTQPLRILHLAPEHIDLLCLLQQFRFSNRLILEIHWPTRNIDPSAVASVDLWLDPKRTNIIMTQYTATHQNLIIKSPNGHELFSIINDCARTLDN